MNAQCFIDLFDSTAFKGERRRIYGPARFDAHLLGLSDDAAMSVRVGEHAALRIERTGGTGTTLAGGAAVEKLEADGIRWLEVKAN